MIVFLISLLIIVATIVLPLKHAFGISLSTSFLFIVPNGFAINSFCFLIVLGRLLLIKAFNKKSTITFDKFFFLFLAYLVFGILSTILFEGKDASEYLKRTFITIVMIFSFINIYKSIKDYDLFIKYCVLGLCLTAVHLYTQTLIPINPFAQASVTTQGRIEPSGLTGQYVSPNTWGFSILLLYGMVSSYWILYRNNYFLTTKTRIRFLLFLGVTVLTFPLLGLLASRSVFILFFGIVLICLLRLNFVRTIFIGLLMGLLMGLLFSVFNLTLSNSLENYTQTLPDTSPVKPLLIRYLYTEQEQKESYKDSREYLARLGFQIYLDHPILGVGLGNEKATFSKPEYFGSDKVAHNTYIALIIELGLFGFIFILAIIFIWLNYLKFPFVWCVLYMIMGYAVVHGIMLSSLPWVIMSFFYQMIKNLEKFRSLEVSSG